MKDFFAAQRPQQGLTYGAFKAQWQARLSRATRGMDRVERRYYHYARYNWDRQMRVEAAYAMSASFRAMVQAIEEPQWWMVLTEDWCVDSAFSLPVMAAAANENPNLSLRILLRDENLDIMDQYLTHGGRAIPKLVVFGCDGVERFRWGAKPSALAALREQLKAQGADGPTIVDATLAWYEAQGWKAVEAELEACLVSVAYP